MLEDILRCADMAGRDVYRPVSSSCVGEYYQITCQQRRRSIREYRTEACLQRVN